MPSFVHEKLKRRLSKLEVPPEKEDEFAVWLRANQHLSLLREDAKGEELILYGSGPHSFVQTVLVDKSMLEKRDKRELLEWSGNPFDAAPSYEADRTGHWIVPGDSAMRTELLQGARSLIIGRTSHDRTYFELLQEFLQVADIHWYDERQSYGKYDAQGDLKQVVSITQREEEPITLITCKRNELDIYLEATHTVLVRLFDFWLRRLLTDGEYQHFNDKTVEKNTKGCDTNLFYRQTIVEGKAAYTRGGQLICSRKSTPASSALSTARVNGDSSGEYVEFLALDWRNDNEVISISTDPAATTNYFQAHGNKLPFELSPAFFRPEVLLKYKGDSEKYTLENNTISCRDAWFLQSYNFNDADQVHVYICDLRTLPYWEQQYWRSFNEEPKEGLASSTIEADFRGEFPSSVESLQMLKATLRKWDKENVAWWKLKDKSLLKRITAPRSGSSDEWRYVFLELDKVVVEGFEVKEIRCRLQQKGKEFSNGEKSIRLLERLLGVSQNRGLYGLHTVHHIRNKAVAHADSGEGRQLMKQALKQHQTLFRHFDSVCRQVADEIEQIDKAFQD